MKRKILIIGVGGIGSFLVPLLDKVGMYDISVADPDKVETKNLTHQNYTEEDVNVYKVSSDMNARYMLVKRVNFPSNRQMQMQGYDLVVCCVADNYQLKNIIQFINKS